MKKLFLPLLMISFFTLAIFCGCGKDKGPTKLTASELIDQGWIKFEAGNFSGASGDFSAAIALDSTATSYTGLLGLGWAELRQSHGGLAEIAFLKYLSKVSVSNDAKAGLALAYLADTKFEDAIASANAVLLSNSGWTFSHASSINHLDLKLVIVQSFYETADYEQSLEAIKLYFDSAFNPGEIGRASCRERV